MYRILFALIVAFGLCPKLMAQSDSLIADRMPRSNGISYVASYYHDGVSALQSLTESRPRQWLMISGLGIGCAFSTRYEYAVNDYFQNNRVKAVSAVTENVFDPFFGKELLGGVVVFTGVSALLNKPKATETGLNALKAGLLASAGMYASKMSVQRARPYMYDSFPYTRSMFSYDFESFPSGHSTNAFAIATVFAEAYKNRKAVPYICYGLAGLTALSRVYDNKHHVSDIIVGSAIGFIVGQTVAQKKHWRKYYRTQYPPQGTGIKKAL